MQEIPNRQREGIVFMKLRKNYDKYGSNFTPYINICNIFFEKLIFPQISISFFNVSLLIYMLSSALKTGNTGIFDTEEC